jgi:hypothetical protein
LPASCITSLSFFLSQCRSWFCLPLPLVSRSWPYVQGAAGAAGAGRLDVVARALEHEREADDYFRIADVRPSSRPGQLRVRSGVRRIFDAIAASAKVAGACAVTFGHIEAANDVH